MIADGRAKADEPCGSYFGNMCGGFGAPLVCEGCGWEKHEHEPLAALRAYMEGVARARAALQEQRIWMAQNPIHWRAPASPTRKTG